MRCSWPTGTARDFFREIALLTASGRRRSRALRLHRPRRGRGDLGRCHGGAGRCAAIPAPPTPSSTTSSVRCVGAELADFNRYATPNAAAEYLVDPEILADPAINPPPEVFERLEFLADLGPEIEALYAAGLRRRTRLSGAPRQADGSDPPKTGGTGVPGGTPGSGTAGPACRRRGTTPDHAGRARSASSSLEGPERARTEKSADGHRGHGGGGDLVGSGEAAPLPASRGDPLGDGPQGEFDLGGILDLAARPRYQHRAVVEAAVAGRVGHHHPVEHHRADAQGRPRGRRPDRRRRPGSRGSRGWSPTRAWVAGSTRGRPPSTKATWQMGAASRTAAAASQVWATGSGMGPAYRAGPVRSRRRDMLAP